MKKTIAIVLVIFCIFFATTVYATDNAKVTTQEQPNTSTGRLLEMRDKELSSMEDYKEAYGNEAYGTAAYILNKVRLYSIPFCFVGIAVSAIFQYVIGIRKLDVRDKGFLTMITFITVLVICQVLPLIFAIVVRGWEG